MYKKEVVKVYQKPNFDQYHKRLEEEKLEKAARDKLVSVVEIKGDPQYEIASGYNAQNMKKGLFYNKDEKMKQYLSNQERMDQQIR